MFVSVCLQACPPKGINFLTALLSLLLSSELLNNIVAVWFSKGLPFFGYPVIPPYRGREKEERGRK